MQTKTCTKCGEEKSLSDFYPHKRGKYGRYAHCKQCHHAYPGKSSDVSKARYRLLKAMPRGRATSLVNAARQRASKSGAACTISVDWVTAILEKGHCQVTGLPFNLTSAQARDLCAPSLDKRDPSLGYTPDNTQVVVWGYNACKGVSSDEAAREFLKAAAKAL
jgi:hypothetical protein